MSKNVVDIDKGWRRIRLHVKELGYVHVDAGVHADSPPYPDGDPLARVAGWQEYGTVNAPARPFMRETARRTLNELRQLKAMVVSAVISGKMTPRGAMQRIGMFYTKAIQATIDASPSWAKPNTAATIKAKGSAHPLIDSDHLRDNITFKMRGKK